MNKEVLTLILKTFNENNNSHAFLLETDDLDQALNDVLNLIKKINGDLIKENSIYNYSDIKIIKPDGREIKKEQIREIIADFQTFPFILKHKYYIIFSSELMNQSSANVLLKFLEEPENSVIGFFLTLNKEAMINTIVSRCQNYKLLYNNTSNKDLVEDKEFISSMESSVYQKILFLNNWFVKDRLENITKLKEIKEELVKRIEQLDDDWKNLINRVNIIDDCINRLLKNANQDLVILDLARKW